MSGESKPHIRHPSLGDLYWEAEPHKIWLWKLTGLISGRAKVLQETKNLVLKSLCTHSLAPRSRGETAVWKMLGHTWKRYTNFRASDRGTVTCWNLPWRHKCWQGPFSLCFFYYTLLPPSCPCAGGHQFWHSLSTFRPTLVFPWVCTLPNLLTKARDAPKQLQPRNTQQASSAGQQTPCQMTPVSTHLAGSLGQHWSPSTVAPTLGGQPPHTGIPATAEISLAGNQLCWVLVF